MLIKTVIFDFDGTLADTFDLAVKVIYESSLNKNLLFSKDEISDLIRNHSLMEIMDKFERNKLMLFYEIWHLKRDFKNKAKSSKIFNGLGVMLKDLKKKNIELGILSSNEETFIDKVILDNDIDFFEFKFFNAGIFRKDKKLDKIIRKFNFKKEEVIYVGDEARDIRACRKEGIKCISVSWGYNSKKRLEEEGAEFIAEVPKDILKIIKEIENKSKEDIFSL